MTVVWERSRGAPNMSVPSAIAAHKLRRDGGCRNARFGGKSFTDATRVLKKRYHSGLTGRKAEARKALRVGKELVLINDGRHRHLVGGIATFDSYHTALAAHSYA